MEHIDGKILPVSLEMLGEARRLFDDFNARYSSNEKIVAVILGNNIKDFSKELIEYGADAVVCADHPELKDLRNTIHTKVISQIALDKEIASRIEPDYAKEFKKPRYIFFAADSIGRHLSSTVLVELESGLASDINKLVIHDMTVTHQIKTEGKPTLFKKTLEMYRPDFSGFLWTTILCLNNTTPSIKREYYPQGCSIIPGVFEPIKPDPKRSGEIIFYEPKIEENDLKVKVLSHKIVKSEVDFEIRKAVVSFGRGIKDAPDENIKLVVELAKQLDAEIGISLPISKKLLPASQAISSTYMIPARVIGTSGSKISPMLYVAIGISGAMQHIAGMQDSEFVVAINPDENSPIKNECDIFINGRMEDVIPLLVEELKKQQQVVQAG
ncbi:MAG: electron transfer flavoprotein subunit alpha/FixB family protein [Thaumarchaeota archaeon]|uniref:Electron transfer flavoprotein subunit alpha/FixB family protein n=1 Tax=Marine Group I thaumarchaeote TaxID=2511932 RepID=A0A7K4MQB8_9ARCH|nr:electron transfer flavoprotein subunit alpha/FixB family protein [Marine Group I thaumarchaeote]NWJ68720.1 electron transfer flavoprotein subunit alpha/FixB family protein [Marine Group I thaumarchaeote]RTZ70879.1 MAG: electron transfer flavoprotein subunit alpha/FixB family protein [Nitrososphaerota archaeon]